MENLVKKEIENLPQEVSLIGLIQSRYSEISQLVTDFKTKSPKLASQRLPIHMRRRAASHNIKRLPSKTRKQIAKKNQGRDVSSEEKEKKRQNHKKHRNKNKVALSHAIREAKADRCLLHLWFVKRFLMDKYFDCLIPLYNTTKNQRILHRMAKKGSIHFYFPYMKSIILRINDKEVAIQKLSELCKCDVKSYILDADAKEVSSLKVHFYEKCEDNSIIGPGHLIYNFGHNFLLIWCHKLFHERLLNHLIQLFRNSSIEIVNGDKLYQSFALFGPESLTHLKRTLKDCGSFLPDKFQDGDIFSVPNWQFVPDSNVKIRTSGPMEVVADENNEESNFFFAQMSTMKDRESILLTVPYQSAKDFWYNLVRNRTHLVGGLRDIKLLAGEIRCLHYPFIGYPDLCPAKNGFHKDIGKNGPTPRKPKQQPELLTLSPSQLPKIPVQRFVLRDVSIINILKDDSLNVEKLDFLFYSNPNLKPNMLLYVELICINRGIPTSGDVVCLPTKEDIKRYIGRTKIDIKLDEIGYGPQDTYGISKDPSYIKTNRRVIGNVEFGFFSMDLGVGKGFAAINLENLIYLVSLRTHDKKLLALIRSQKSSTFRFVEIIIDHFSHL